MLSLIEVKCPHCGAKGQIMLPPLGSIIVGPCPQCEEMVAVFCGTVLPLRKEIILEGSGLEKREHLLEVLGGFLRERIERLLDAQSASQQTAGAESEESEDDADLFSPEIEEHPDRPSGKVTLRNGGAPRAISQEELDKFVSVDLKLIDNKAYFRAVFE